MTVMITQLAFSIFAGGFSFALLVVLLLPKIPYCQMIVEAARFILACYNVPAKV